MRAVRVISTALTVIGGLNWGLVGAFDWNLVDEIFGEGSTGSRVVYCVVGVAAVVCAVSLLTRRREARH